VKKMQTKEQIEDLIKHYYSQRGKQQFVPGKTRIPLNIPSYDWEEVCEALESMLSTYVTMGKKVAQFETMFADYSMPLWLIPGQVPISSLFPS
jgi:CDP-6-deoxy-D-xylo-4-hexulose-3-dehydrase